MNVREIVAWWLKCNGYDGLFSDNECGCFIDDLMPCGETYSDCRPGRRVPCPGGDECVYGGCDFHIQGD